MIGLAPQIAGPMQTCPTIGRATVAHVALATQYGHAEGVFATVAKTQRIIAPRWGDDRQIQDHRSTVER